MGVSGVGGSGPIEMPQDNNSQVDQILQQIQKLQAAFENPNYSSNPQWDYLNFKSNLEDLEQMIKNSGLSYNTTESRLINTSLQSCQDIVNEGQDGLVALQSDYFNNKTGKAINGLMNAFTTLNTTFNAMENPSISQIDLQVLLVKNDLEYGNPSDGREDYQNFRVDYFNLLNTLSQQTLSPSQKELVSEFKSAMDPLAGNQDYFLGIQSDGNFSKYDPLFDEMKEAFA